MAKVGTTQARLEDFAKALGEESQAMQVFVQAPPGAGKTVFALSASKFWPEDNKFPWATEPPVRLEDVGIFAFDTGALDCIARSGVEVPREHVISVPDLLPKYNEDPLEIVRLGLHYFASIASIEVVLLDTLTVYDHMLCTKHEAAVRDTRDGGSDEMPMYRLIKQDHIHTQQACSRTRFLVVYNSHSYLPIDLATSGQAKVDKSLRTKATQAGGGAQIKPDVTGRGVNAYVGNSSIFGTIEKVVGPKVGSKQTSERWFIPFSNEFQTKTRFEHLLADREPPYLRGILRKVGKV